MKHWNRLWTGGGGLVSLAVIGALILSGCTTSADRDGPEAPGASAEPLALSGEERQAHVESFDEVWRIVRDQHWDPDLNGVDWDAARDELRPRVVDATTDGEARVAMQALLNRLGQSHFAIIPKNAYEEFEAVTSEAASDRRDKRDADDADGVTDSVDDDSGRDDGWAGLEVRQRDGVLLVTRVHEGSPADLAGIRAGWTLEEISGASASALLSAAAGASGVERPETVVAMMMLGLLNSDAGDVLDLVLVDGSGERRAVELTLEEAPGQLATFGNLPPMPVVIEERTLDDGIGYFRLNVFFDPPRVLPAYRSFVSEHRDAPGLIIDMRGNLGGIILMSSGMMNFLIDESGMRLGTMRLRDAIQGAFEMPIMLNPRGVTYDGKVAVLIDELSISNAEILAAGLKDIGRARLFGTRTAGLVLPSTVERLPNGDGFQYAFASYTSSSGEVLEGVGVSPDAEILESSSGLLVGVDGPLAAAVAWIQNEEPQTEGEQ